MRHGPRPSPAPLPSAWLAAVAVTLGTVSATGSSESRDLQSSGNTSIMCVIARNSTSTPRYTLWNGSSWGANTALPWSAANTPLSVAARACPTRNEVLFGLIDNDKQIRGATFSGTAWTSSTVMTTDAARKDERSFDITYEALSGRGMLAYWSQTAGHFAYRIWNGSTWSAEVLMTGSGTDHSHYVALTSNPATDEIILLCQDHNSGIRLLARVWDGTSWSNWAVLETGMPDLKHESFAAAWERDSGRALVVYAKSGQSQPRYRTWNGAWSGESSLPTLGDVPRWFRLESEPGSNRIFMLAGDAGDDVESNVWNGSAWGSNVQLSSDTDSSDQRRFDIVLEPGSNRPVCMYRVKNKNYPVFRVWSSTAWGSEQNGPNINRKPVYFSLCPGPSSNEVFAGVQDDQGDLHLMRWTGTSWSSATTIETTLSSGRFPMALVGVSPSGVKRRIVSWTEVEPN